jgi:cation:H+ antiporter
MDWLWLTLGLICAGLGGELFIKGSVGLAKHLRVPAGIIGATVAAFATSSPELSVSVSASLAGVPELALGDALGSNIVNFGVVLGIAIAMGAIRAPRGSVKRDFPMAVFAPLVTALLVLDGQITRFDAAGLLALFAGWLTVTIIEARRERVTAEIEAERRTAAAVTAFTVGGLAFLVLAGYLVVTGAKGIGAALGLDKFVVGATIVAVGTSLPELATVVVSKLRGHEEVGLGTVLGSNIFNGLFIVGVAAMIHPIPVRVVEVATGIGFGLALVLAAFPPKSGWIARRSGALLLGLYVAYVVAILQAA